MRGPITLLKDSWGIFTSNPKLFLGIYLLPAILSIAVSFFIKGSPDNEYFFNSATDVGIFSLGLIVIVVINIFMGVAMIKAVSEPKSTTVIDAYTFAKQYFIPYVWISFLVGVVTFVGFFLLIIPGIIFSVWFAFSYFVMIFENERGFAALRASKLHVQGKWWAVFGRYIAIAAVAFVIMVVTGFVVGMLGMFLPEVIASTLFELLNFVLVPVGVAYSYCMYVDLKESKEITTIDEDAAMPEVSSSAV